LWLDWPRAHAQAGDDTWYAVKVLFPTAFQATTGQWNWIVEWHDDPRTSATGAVSTALAVYTDFPVSDAPGKNPRLAFRVKGGSVNAPQQFLFTMPRNSLRLNHWYDLRIHFVWSPDPRTGLVQLWIDGRRVVSTRFPTLYTIPGGETSYNYFGLYNYRLKAAWAATVSFDRVRIGPTAASVATPRRPPRPPAVTSASACTS
jgi:hypothetical protein